MHLNGLKPGLRLEVRRTYDEKISGQKKASWQVSQLLDHVKSDYLMIAAPVHAAGIVEWPIGSELEITYVQPERGIWRLKGAIAERGVTNHIVYYRVRQTSEAKRYQRRAYYRLACSLDVSWQLLEKVIPFQVGLPYNTMPQLEALQAQLQPVPTHDISGGGICVISELPLPVKAKLNMTIQLENRDIIVQGQVVRCLVEKQGKEKRYYISVAFTKIRTADQERIIQYIFKCQKQRLAHEGLE